MRCGHFQVPILLAILAGSKTCNLKPSPHSLVKAYSTSKWYYQGLAASAVHLGGGQLVTGGANGERVRGRGLRVLELDRHQVQDADARQYLRHEHTQLTIFDIVSNHPGACMHP